MRTKFLSSFRRGGVALIAVMTVLSFAIAAVQGGVLKEARVTQVIKDVKLLPSQAAPKPATVNDDVRGDTGVRTGGDSRAELTFSDLTIARLGANTIFSFNEGTRTIALSSGAILLRVPKDSGGAKVQTAAVTAAITGTTVMVEYHPKSYAKYLVLEGTMRIYLKGVLGESVLMTAGQMMILNPNATRLSEVVDYDVERLWKTSLLTQGFSRSLGSEPLVADAQHVQLERKAAGELLDTNLVIFGRGTLVTMTDPQSLDVIDRKTSAVTLPTPAPPVPTPTPTPPPVPTPTPTPVQTPVPTPSKFGTPPPIVSFVPYPVDNGTVIQTDPAITRAGVTDFGKIYRDAVQDGPFSTWAFTVTSLFDLSVGINAPYASNNPVAAFKFVGLQLVGNPTISTANGGATNLALISVGPMTSAPAGNTVFTFGGLQSVLLATQNGSITLSGISFQNIPLLIFYARGAASNLTLGSPISNVASLQLFAENNIQINAAESVAAGTDGGIWRGVSAANFDVNAPIDAVTGLTVPGTFLGAGGTVSLSALGGTINVNSRIQVSSNDPAVGTPIRRSASGGTIGLDSGLTTGTGITLSSTASLLSLLNAGAPGPGGSITLTTAGSDIITNGATLQADRGTITIQQTSTASAGTAQITLNGGAIISETLIASSRGDLTIGTTSHVNLSAVTISLHAENNFTWDGGTLTATASNSSGNVMLQSENDIIIGGAVDIERFNGGITDGLNILIHPTFNLNVAGPLKLITDGSGLTNGGRIDIITAGAMTFGAPVILQTGPSTTNQATGSYITLNSGGPITAADFFAMVRIGAGKTLSTGGTITVTGGASYLASNDAGGIDLQVNNSAPGDIGSGANIALTLNGSLTTGGGGQLNLLVNNSNGGSIQTGGNITAMVGGNVNANAVNLQIDNRLNGFIGSGAGMTFAVGGTLTTTSDANFTILNSMLGTPGGTIGSDAFIKITLSDATVGRDLNAFIDNSDGSIGGAGGTVTLQINGKLSVAGRINVFGTVTSTGTIDAGTLSATDVTAPGIQVGAGGITRFSFPDEVTINVPHTITTGALSSTGGINFNGPDFNTPAGFGPFDGGQLTINVPALTFGSAAADNIQGPVTFNGGDSPNTTVPAGSGGTFNLNTTGALTVNSSIQATTGRRPDAAGPSGAGGTVNFNSTGGTVDVNSTIIVSSNDATPPSGLPPPRRRSASGGNINLQSNAATGLAINVSNTGQLLSLLDAAAPGPGGKITILATGANSRIAVTGNLPISPGAAAPDSVRADRGSIDIRHTGSSGSISLTNSNILADIVKVGALGDNGVLTIGGGGISANSVLKLYANGPNGQINFIANVSLNGSSQKIIAGNAITIFNGVVVTIGGANPAQIFVNRDLNGIFQANYTGFGGNSSTTGSFSGAGATDPQPLANAPAFGPPGSP